MAALAGAGFRVVAPWLRGHPPTQIPRSGYFDIGTLALDARELIRVLGGGDRCLLVGQDWGALIGYQVLDAFPKGAAGGGPARSLNVRVERFVTLRNLPPAFLPPFHHARLPPGRQLRGRPCPTSCLPPPAYEPP
jgi:pimeloyl-ACP methyl ester carboxylesterase